MEKRELEERLFFALSLADRVKEYLLGSESIPKSIEEKGKNDFVTATDKKVEAIISSALSSAFPLDGFYGEESGKKGEDKRRWIIDPIDGTVNYMNSIPLYTVSIAFEDELGSALGVVIAPRQNEVFYALRGSGAYLNGKRIFTNESPEFSNHIAILVPPHRRHDRMEKYLQAMTRLYDVCTDARSIGSAALSLCYIAAGRASMYYEIGIYPYDFSAGKIILEEAGGIFFSKETGDGDYCVIASVSTLYSSVMEAIGD